MTLRVLSFFALVFTAVALIPVGAHLFALPNKIGMAQQPYFIAQSVYYGWALLGLVLVPAVLIDAGLAMMLRCEGLAFKLAAAGSLCMAATLVIFFIWVYPAMWRRRTGLRFRRIGRCCGGNGNGATRSMPF